MKKEIQVATACLAAAKEIIADFAMLVTVLSELDGVFLLKVEQNGTESFFNWENALVP